MKNLSIIMAYYDNPEMLDIQLDNIAQYPLEIRENIELIIIDDASPRWPARINGKIYDFKISLYRTLKDIPWNQDFCRNVGAYAANNEWLLFTDIDHLIPRRTIEALFNKTVFKDRKYNVYRFARISAPDMQPYKPHPNSWVIARDFYRDVLKGYDERFAGHYGTDGDFRDRINKFTDVIQLDIPLIRIGRETIPDASTTTLVRKKPEDGAAIQRIKRERMGAEPKVLSFEYEEIKLW